MYELTRNQAFPYTTLLINIFGSLALGMIVALSLQQRITDQGWIIFLSTGLCGGFTTFSAFSMENILLLEQGKTNLALLYMLASLVLGIGAAWAGFKLFNA
jgi:fluoride exporter